MEKENIKLSAGTQVVSLVEVRGTNNSLVHPRGAVGVVTRTPAGDQDQFLVRFPDGYEAALQREQLDVLKHFKDRLGGQNRSADFDLESFIICPWVVCSRVSLNKHFEVATDSIRHTSTAMTEWPSFQGSEFEESARQQSI